MEMKKIKMKITMITQRILLQSGKLIACYSDKYKEETQIGKILEIKEDMTTVNWMSGSYSDPWHPYKVRGDLWTEDIAKTTGICEVKLSHGFRLVQLVNKG